MTIAQQIRPRLGGFAIAVGERDEFLATIGSHPDYRLEFGLTAVGWSRACESRTGLAGRDDLVQFSHFVGRSLGDGVVGLVADLLEVSSHILDNVGL